jgi:DNA polymerase-3 subunit gamma/tau
VSYRVFARKYRPQRFEEVVGQEHITRTLQNAITGKRLAQAYLFVGPRGVGKTSSARILAKALNCLSNKGEPTDNPCGTCDACVEIAEGRSLDVMEIDGASNNSVDSIRTLRENAAYAPARGPYKVYLIDEVHMLSTAAFNALLKTLEEPPEHVKFLFATTEAQKVPATILSRCQRFDLRRLTPELIADHLLHIAKKEQIALDPAAAATIARGADGAMRDAESMLDQVVAFCGTTIGAADVHNVFGFTPRETVLELAGALVARDTPAALAVVKSQAEAGKDLARLLGDLVGLLRDILIGKVHPSAEATEEARLGEAISQQKLLVLLDHFGEAEGRLRWATDKKLQLDVALIKGVHLLEEASLSDVLDTLTALRGGAPLPDRPVARPSAPRPTAPVAAPAPSPAPVPAPKATPLPEAPIRTEPPKVESKAAPVESSVDGTSLPGSGAAPAGLTTSVVRGSSQSLGSQPPTPSPQLPTPNSSDPWQEVAMKLAADSPLKFGWVEDGRFIERIGNAILVEFPPSLEQQTQTLFWPQAVKKIEEQLTAALGVKITFEYRFTGEEPPAPPEPEPVGAPAPSIKEASQPNRTAGKPTEPAPKQTAPEPAAPAISAAELEEFKSDPLIRKALEIFKAEILIDPPQKA